MTLQKDIVILKFCYTELDFRRPNMSIANQNYIEAKSLTISNNSHSQAYLNLYLPFICLFLIELITFGIHAKDVGVYQDEWIYLSKLHFVPQSLSGFISTYFWDPRILVRPIEALHFGPLFYFVHENPLWYHIICYVFEFFGAWFLFLAVSRLVNDRSTALTAAILFLLYPTHDVTHYEIVASSLAISMSFFTGSLWLYLKGIDENRYGLIAWSAFAYFLSLYNYELCLPLAPLYALIYLSRQNPLTKVLSNVKQFIAYQIPPFGVAFSMILYRRLLFNMQLGYRYALVYDLVNFSSVIWSGLIVSLSPYTVTFSISMLFEALKSGFSIFSLICLCAIASSVFFTLKAPATLSTSKNKMLLLVTLGLITIVLSYTIYGLSPEHKPVIDAWLNRVNVGSSLGSCFVIAGLFALFKDHFEPLKGVLKSSSARQSLYALIISLLAAALIIIDWQFAKPWIVSWQAQKELMNVLRIKSNEIKPGDSIILGGIIRYASKWVPVVDGIWDFGGIICTTLNDQSIKGTVVTDRLVIEKDLLVDKYGDIVLGTFPFKQMILYAPNKNVWKRISSRQEFIKEARKLGWSIPESKSSSPSS